MSGQDKTYDNFIKGNVHVRKWERTGRAERAPDPEASMTVSKEREGGMVGDATHLLCPAVPAHLPQFQVPEVWGCVALISWAVCRCMLMVASPHLVPLLYTKVALCKLASLFFTHKVRFIDSVVHCYMRLTLGHTVPQY